MASGTCHCTWPSRQVAGTGCVGIFWKARKCDSEYCHRSSRPRPWDSALSYGRRSLGLLCTESKSMNQYVVVSLLLLAVASSATLGLKPTTRSIEARATPEDGCLSAQQDPARPSVSIETATEQWWLDYEATRALFTESGVQRDGVVYRWTGPSPVTIAMVKLGVQDGEDVFAPEPVAYAIHRSSPFWVEDYPLISSLSLPGPLDCNAKLVKGPPPSVGMRFVCEQQCGSGISCLASQASPQQMGYCSCAGVNPPSYCYGDFTTTDSGLTWTIQCSGPCLVPLGCSIKTVNDSGFEIHWCECQ